MSTEIGRKKARFIRYPYDVWFSSAFAALTHSGRLCYGYFEVARWKPGKGRSKNRVPFGPADCRPLCQETAAREGITALERCGFIDMVSKGQFPGKKAVYAPSERWRDYGRAVFDDGCSPF